MTEISASPEVPTTDWAAQTWVHGFSWDTAWQEEMRPGRTLHTVGCRLLNPHTLMDVWSSVWLLSLETPRIPPGAQVSIGL